MRLFEVSKPLIFRDYLKVLEAINEEPTLKLSEDGLNVEMMNPEHTAMLLFNLPVGYFDIWSVQESVKTAINVVELNRVLKRMNKDDSHMKVEYNHETTRLTFTLISDIHRNKTIPTLDPLDEEIPTPKIFFKSKTRMLLSTFKRILEDFKDSSEYFKLETTWNQIKFSTNSDYAHESTPIDRDSDSILEHHVEEESSAHYKIEEMLNFVKSAMKVSEVVTLEYSTDMPLKLDLEIPIGSMVYYLAPMIGV